MLNKLPCSPGWRWKRLRDFSDYNVSGIGIPPRNIFSDIYSLSTHGTGLTDVIGEGMISESSTLVDGGIMSEDTMDLLIKDTQDVFVETCIFKTVEDTLKKHRHVTISGASGEGKTSTALMVGVKYREKGYKLILVNDVDKFKLSLAKYKKVFLIFDDIFGSVGLTTEIHHLKRLLQGLQLTLENSRSRMKTDIRQETGPKHVGSGKKIYVIFTTKTYNLEYAMPKLEGQEYFFYKGPAVLDVTRKCDYRYTPNEKKSIIQKHKDYNNFEIPEEFEEICTSENNVFGFPLTCSLYSKFHGFQKDFHKFFKEPLFYLKCELNKILRLMNEQSAALILMLLCDNSLNLHQLEVQSDNERLESSLRTVESVVKSITRAGIATAAKGFRGTYFTEGDVFSFGHPTIYDACACALYNINSSLVLEHCSIKFLYERVQPFHVQSTEVDDHLHIIYLSEEFYDLIASRLAEGIQRGNLNMTISHPVLKEKILVDKLFDKLKLKKTNKIDRFIGNKKTKRETILHNRDDGKFLLQWAMLAQSINLVEKILSTGYRFTKQEIIESFYTCSKCGNNHVMTHLLTKYSFLISVDHLNKALAFAIDNNNKLVITLLVQNGAVFSDMTREQKKILFCIFAEEKNMEMCKRLINTVYSNEEITDTVFKRCTNATFKDVCNKLLEVACRHNNITLVDVIADSCDVNVIQGEHGRTKVMKAALHCQTDLFHLLAKKGADLTLTDMYGDTVFHLACRGGNTSIVKHLLPSFDINSQGNNGWTPVMKAAVNGRKEVFHQMVMKEANLTLTDNYGDTVLHLACQGGNTFIVEHLLPLFDINHRGKHGWTPVMKSIVSGKKEVFDLLVTKGADLTLTDNYDDAVLHLACRGGNTAIVIHLLPLFDINIRGGNGRTPVMNAAVSSKKEVFDLLMAKGTDLTLVDNNGNTLHHLACQGGNEAIVKLTLPLFPVNVKSHWAHTPLMKSASFSHFGIFNLLLQHGADTSLVDQGGDTILHLACEDGNLDMVKFVLPYSDINMKNNPGWTPLMAALVNGKSKVYQYLADEGADLTVVDKAGEDVLTLAQRGGCSDVVKQLSDIDHDLQGVGKWTQLMKLLVYGIFILEKYNIGSSELIQTDDFGDSLLHLACRGGNKRCVEHLLPSYDINVRGRYGSTPLMMAARCGHLEVFQYLVSHQADLSLVSDTGEHVLRLAQRGEHEDIVTYLLTLPMFKDKTSEL